MFNIYEKNTLLFLDIKLRREIKFKLIYLFVFKLFKIIFLIKILIINKFISKKLKTFIFFLYDSIIILFRFS